MARIQTNETTSRRDIIIDIAAKLFKDKGFKAASMRELADGVGVEAASLYNHIKNKNELLNIICFDIANNFMENIEKVEMQPISSIEKIENILRFHISEMVNNFDEVYVSDREWKHLSEPYLSNFQNQRRTYRKRFAKIIEDGISKKEIKKIDASTAVLIMLHSVSGIESWHRSTQRIEGKDLEENMVAILVGGLKK